MGQIFQISKHTFNNRLCVYIYIIILDNLIIDCVYVYIYRIMIMMIIIITIIIIQIIDEHHISYGYYSSSSTTLLTGREYQNTLLFGGMRGQRLQMMSVFLTSSTLYSVVAKEWAPSARISS